MVVSGEVNLWPNPDFADQMPASSKTGHYKFPNSGGYMAEIPYLIELFDGMGIAWKSDCVDDQGELIKAIALDSDAFRIDHEAELFQTLFGLCCDYESEIRFGHYYEDDITYFLHSFSRLV